MQTGTTREERALMDEQITQLETDCASGTQIDDDAVVRTMEDILDMLLQNRESAQAKHPGSARLAQILNRWLSGLDPARRTRTGACLAQATPALHMLDGLGWALLAHVEPGPERAATLEISLYTVYYDTTGPAVHERAHIMHEAVTCLETVANGDDDDALAATAEHLGRMNLITGKGAMAIVGQTAAIIDPHKRFMIEACAGGVAFTTENWDSLWLEGENSWIANPEHVDSDALEELWLRLTTKANDEKRQIMLAHALEPMIAAIGRGEPIAGRCGRIIRATQHMCANEPELANQLRRLEPSLTPNTPTSESN